MHYYQFNIGDYQSHTNHLTPEEDIIYRRLIDWCYLHEKPLPLDHAEIGILIRMRTHSDGIANVLKWYFKESRSGYHQKRIDDEIKKYKNKSKKAQESANKRWNKENKGSEGDANAMRTQCDGNAKHKPINNNHKPINKTLDQLDIDRCFDQFWQSGIRKVNKKKAESLFASILKNKKDQGWSEFTEILVEDIKARISANQLGFSEMHPTTYLNGERWNDEIKVSKNETYQQSNKPESALARFSRKIQADIAAEDPFS